MEPSNQELYRLVKENNKMLHAMRRNAFIGGIFKTIFYIFVLIVAPLWIYNNYLFPVMNEFNSTMTSFKSTGSKAEVQLESLQAAWKSFQEKLPGPFQPKTGN